ncbi:MAG: type II toxin-antitoxin system VapC family toxin [Rhizobiaceae bacterium]
MRLLLDTHILLALGRGDLASRYPKHNDLVNEEGNERVGSAASLWEMTIKVGLQKLDLGMTPLKYSQYLSDLGVSWQSVTPEHATFALEPLPLTRDPFDRMLLAQCAVDGMKLVTADGLLVGHPLVVRV